ncbi:MAG: ribulose-phosphate 3-epimerase [Puniceicoccales bacterium]|jgi:ribulose-phosphate 3-epimerase|nr:ribulose-phosphate 3-epimerase [Puniceicoccales bacterium]
MHEKILAPSIFAYDNCYIGDGLKVIEASGATWVHVDAMDGTFVPTIALGQGVVSALRKRTKLFLDVHLMVQTPGNLIESFAAAGADMLTFHCESASAIEETLQMVKNFGLSAGLALNPRTAIHSVEKYLDCMDAVLVMGVEPGKCRQKFLPSTCEKVRTLASLREKRGLAYKISVDGGINAETLPLAAKAGADIFVTGSAFFSNAEQLGEFFSC